MNQGANTSLPNQPNHQPRSPFRWAKRITAISGVTLGFAMVFAACGGSDELPPGGQGAAGTSTGGTSAGGNSGASGSGLPIGGQGGNGGSGLPQGGSAGSVSVGGNAGNSAGGNAGSTTAGGSAGSAGAMCMLDPAPHPKKCRPATQNECDGQGLSDAKPEGAGTANPNGNGFDDDCDGLVDEGCPCPALGNTKDCYLLPSTQTSGAPDYNVLGWCATQEPGKLTCQKVGSGEFAKLQFTGECSGAQPPQEERCEPGDFNCDGLDSNQCDCNPVSCPDTIFTRPFPDPKNVGKFSKDPAANTLGIDGIDGTTWVKPEYTTSNWRWTVTGGPCDDILPHPSFAVFKTSNTQPTGNPDADWASEHLGSEVEMLQDPLNPADTIQYKQGWQIQGMSSPSKIYPAFSLSGDYYVSGTFDYSDSAGNKKTASCTQIVKVRAPGLRVELCWPERGVGTLQNDNDVDLHVARLQGGTATPHGWFTSAGPTPNSDDCYYSPNSSCGNRTLNNNSLASPSWFSNDITPEVNGVGVCHGWGSRRFPDRPCISPRLDRDNITCNPAIDNPNAPEKDPNQIGTVVDNFCGPENINIDSGVLKGGEKFAIGVQCYNCVKGNNGDANAQPAQPRVNIYCNGELKLGLGYDPRQAADPAQGPASQYPKLFTEGQNTHGSLWSVAQVTWNANAADPCSIVPVAPNGDWKDGHGDTGWQAQSNGSNLACVNNGPENYGANNYSPPAPPNPGQWKFATDGSYPSTVGGLCHY
jgi:hypothetical protein